MKKNIIKIWATILITLFIHGCECSVTTAKLSDAKVCTQLETNLCAQDNTIIDSSSDVIYASCILKGAPENTRVKFTWFYYGDTKFEIDHVVLSTLDKIGNIELHSTLSQPLNGWPKGVYEVRIEIEDVNKEPLVKQFSIQ